MLSKSTMLGIMSWSMTTASLGINYFHMLLKTITGALRTSAPL